MLGQGTCANCNKWWNGLRSWPTEAAGSERNTFALRRALLPVKGGCKWNQGRRRSHAEKNLTWSPGMLAGILQVHFLPMVTSSLPQPMGLAEAGPAFLARAFSSFTEAAASLERSYAQLQMEVAGLRRELEETNRDLLCSLEENQRMRERLNRILEALPCGVVTVEANGTVSLANPEAARLLGVTAGRL